ncbi:hypothetical protein FQZ97_1184350 [compost metagenome]
MQCGNIDTHVYPKSLLIPAAHLLQRRLEHPLADIDNDQVMFDRGQEGPRLEQAQLRVLPADQGFQTNQFTAAQADLGLVVKAELVVVQCELQLFQALLPGSVLALLARLEK